ncbi:MAG: hypothetical protein ACR2F6_15565 [Mycobacteriales bacterium]
MPLPRNGTSESAIADAKEKTMADVGDLIGQIRDPASAPPVPAGA